MVLVRCLLPSGASKIGEDLVMLAISIFGGFFSLLLELLLLWALIGSSKFSVQVFSVDE